VADAFEVASHTYRTFTGRGISFCMLTSVKKEMAKMPTVKSACEEVIEEDR
jgi:hypothetical protein